MIDASERTLQALEHNAHHFPLHSMQESRSTQREALACPHTYRGLISASSASRSQGVSPVLHGTIFRGRETWL